MPIPKIIKEGGSEDVTLWNAPTMEDGELGNLTELHGLVTADQLSKVQDHAFKEAHEQGFAQGYQEGMDIARQESAQKLIDLEQDAQHLAQLLQALSKPFEQLDEEVTQELLSLAVTIARLIIRRELKTDPGQIVAVVREAMSALPGMSRNLQINLHPEDATLIRQIFSMSDDQAHWHLVDDPSLTRGDCRVLTESSRIDATLENRLAAIIAQALGGEREHDAKPP